MDSSLKDSATRSGFRCAYARTLLTNHLKHNIRKLVTHGSTYPLAIIHCAFRMVPQ